IHNAPTRRSSDLCRSKTHPKWHRVKTNTRLKESRHSSRFFLFRIIESLICGVGMSKLRKKENTAKTVSSTYLCHLEILQRCFDYFFNRLFTNDFFCFYIKE